MKRTLEAFEVSWPISALLSWIVCTAGCGHPAARPVTAGTAPSGTLAGASEPQLDVSTLRLGMKQVPSATDVIFEFSLTNIGREPVQITTNPRFRDRTMHPIGDRGRDAEIEFRLVDEQGRLVPKECLFSSAWAGYRAQRSLLLPGQSQTFSFSLVHRCYSLISGERLSVSASYANLFDGEAGAARGVPAVSTPAPTNVVVPLGWPESDATKYGYASERVVPGSR